MRASPPGVKEFQRDLTLPTLTDGSWPVATIPSPPCAV
jgi:hypothetical protein